MMNILIASKNLHKFNEFKDMISEVNLIRWPDSAPDIPEDGAFFQDNAIQKALFAKKWWIKYGELPINGIISDDSGLCVNAFWGGPGVLSARFAKDLSPIDKNNLLLSMMPDDYSNRDASFVCVLTLIHSGNAPYIAIGSINGKLALEPKGKFGFGYDTIFIPDGQNKTFGELSPNVKQQISHRGKAVSILMKNLNLYCNSQTYITK